MWNIPIRKFFAAIRSRALAPGGEKGQTIVEYLLILVVVLSIFMVFAKPFMKDLNKKFETASKKGFFAEDPSGGNFYYFPMP
jgi:Tfp pilus assembly protein FimT